MEIDCKPEELDEFDRRIMQLEIETEALQEGKRRGLEGPPPDAGEGTGGPREESPTR